jgi:hypothetical protein
MTDTMQKTAWGVRGSSTRGASHLRTGLPNQDSIGTWWDEPRSRAIVVVSDGHGSARHFRSDTGSRLAVEAAMSVLREVSLPLSEAEAHALSSPIVLAWRTSVKAHLAEHPFEAADWQHVPDAELEQVQAALAENPVVAYGATLLTVLAAGADLLFLQLGDGDILCVGDDGTATRPMNEDSRLIANQTTSLCQNEAPERWLLEFILHRCGFPAGRLRLPQPAAPVRRGEGGGATRTHPQRSLPQGVGRRYYAGHAGAPGRRRCGRRTTCRGVAE